MTIAVALLVGCGGGGGGGGGGGIGGGNNGGGGGVPSAPTTLKATAGNTKVALTWTASAGASTYNVKRSTTNGGPYTTVINFVNTTNFTDTGLSNGTTYFYVVTAVNASGESGFSNQASATPSAGGGGGPSWLPGNTIFYTTADPSDATTTDLDTVNPDGSNQSVFATEPSQFQAVAPNPNVQGLLVFAYTTDPNPGSDPNATYGIYRNSVVDIFGATQLTDPSTLALNSVGDILFTPDGTHIYFTGAVGSDHALYVMNTNGTNLTRIDSADDAALSPDGTKIIYSQSQGVEDDILWIGVNEASGHFFTSTPGLDEITPQWSKDGTTITYSGKDTSNPAAPYDIYIEPFNGGAGGTVQKLTANGDFNLSPSFSPSGTQLAFIRISTTDTTKNGVYLVGSTGGSQTNIIFDSGIGTSLYWTGNNGRAVGGGSPMAVSRTLKKINLPLRSRR